jgi:hypothetical protein
MRWFERKDRELVQAAIYLNGKRVKFGFAAGQINDNKDYRRELEDLFDDIEDKTPTLSQLEKKSWVTLQKLKQQKHRVFDKLVEIGAIDPVKAKPLTLGEAFDEYISIQHWKKRTVQNWMNTLRKLLRRWEEDTPLADITLTDMQKHVQKLRLIYSVATLHKDVRNIRQLWDYFYDNRTIPNNDMRKLKFAAKQRELVAVKQHIDEEWFNRALDCIISKQHRALLCYYRWLGARQNDPVGDSWEDIDWERKTVNRSNVKDDWENIGRVPIPWQLMKELRAWHDEVVQEEGKATGSIFPWLTECSCNNQRKYFKCRMRQKGVPIWKNFFNALRSTRSQEIRRMANGRSLEIMLIGHTAAVADKHYDQLINADFDAITSAPEPRIANEEEAA